jgi:hypothetical protein
MNWKFPVIASAIVTALGLASCGGLSKSNNQTISNPTVEEMKSLEAQWGVKPGAPATPGAKTPAYAPSAGAPASFAPAPSAPTVPMTPAPAPLQFEAVPPTPAAPPSAPPSIPPSLR